MQVDFLTQYILSVLPAKRKTSANGWISFNAPCCSNRGESTDSRGRGGIILNATGGISYHCFNCNYKTAFVPGRPLSYKFRKLLSWLGVDSNTIQHLTIKAIQLKEFVRLTETETIVEETVIDFKERTLPDQSHTITKLAEVYSSTSNAPKELLDAIEYVCNRNTNLNYDFYWTPITDHKLNQRIIVPFYWKNKVIGYSARAIYPNIKPKFYSDIEPNYVYNTNMQKPESKFVIVVEGVFDAIAVDGVAVLSNECNETQADIIDSLGREVIVVPDFDVHVNNRNRKVWPGATLIDQAVEYGWSVSFPIWANTCKDVSEAVNKYGKLFTLKTILDNKHHNKLKIELLKRKMFNNQTI